MTPADILPVLALHHLGSLHAYETALVLLVAFGPFLVIVGLVLRERRRAATLEAREDSGAPAEQQAPVGPGGPRGT